jgi:hypothetical protein
VPPPPLGTTGRRGRVLNAFALSFADLVDGFYASFFSDPLSFIRDRRIRSGGLRGGSFVAGENVLRLDRYEFVPGVRLSGRWNQERDVLSLRIDGPGRLDGRVLVSEVGTDLTLRLRGRIGGRRVRAIVIVPSRLTAAIEESLGGLAAAAALPLRP